jgi:hypothetical protein
VKRLSLLLLCAIAFGSCDSGLDDVITIVNESPQPLRFEATTLDPGGENVQVLRAGMGSAARMSDILTLAVLVADRRAHHRRRPTSGGCTPPLKAPPWRSPAERRPQHGPSESNLVVGSGQRALPEGHSECRARIAQACGPSRRGRWTTRPAGRQPCPTDRLMAAQWRHSAQLGRRCGSSRSPSLGLTGCRLAPDCVQRAPSGTP